MNYYLITLIIIFIDALVDGLQDGLDFRKGAEDMKHIWHLLKHFNRTLWALAGYFGITFLIQALILPVYEYIFFVLSLFLVFILAKGVWKYFRYDFVDKLYYLDEHIDLSIGIRLVDDFFGFDKPIKEPIFKWPWR